MRLSEKEKDIIKTTVWSFDSVAQLRLFGSRTDDNARGGDIDLLIISKVLSYREKLLIRSDLKKRLGNRKIDIIIVEKPESAFTRNAFNNSLVI